MYALYSKNKPQSDALLSSHGNEFFKVRLETLVTSHPHTVAGHMAIAKPKHATVAQDQDFKNKFKKQTLDVLFVD